MVKRATGEKLGIGFTRGVLEVFEKQGIDTTYIKNLTDHFDQALKVVGKVDPGAVNSLMKTVSQLDMNSVNASIGKVTEILKEVNPDDVSKLIKNAGDAAGVIANSAPAIQSALTGISWLPWVFSANCLVNLVTGAMTVSELKKANKKLDSMLDLVAEQLRISREQLGVSQEQLKELCKINHSLSYEEKETREIKTKRKDKIKTNYQKGKYLDSVGYSNEFLTSPDPKIFYYRGLSLYELGYYLAAIDNFDRAIKLDHNNNSNYFYWRGLAFLHLGLMEAAEQNFNFVCSKRPEWLEAKAHLLLSKKDYNTAKEKYSELVSKQAEGDEITIKLYNLHYLLGICNFELKRNRDAKLSFELAAREASCESKKTELVNIKEFCLEKRNLLISAVDKRYVELIANNNLAINTISFVEGDHKSAIFMKAERGERQLVVSLRKGMQVHAKGETYLLSEIYIKCSELVDGFYYCQLAAELGHEEAKAKIAKCHEILEEKKTFDLSKDPSFIPKLISKAFSSQSSQLSDEQKKRSLAKYYAAVMLFRGLFGKDKNLELAFKYLNEIERDNLLAKVMLGYFYQYSSQDYIKARKYYEKASALPLAKWYLALLYYRGHGVSKDIKLATQYFRESYNEGMGLNTEHPDFLQMYREDRESELEWLTQAAEHGNAEAQYSLGVYYTEQFEALNSLRSNVLNALKFFYEAQQQGYPGAEEFWDEIYLELSCGSTDDPYYRFPDLAWQDRNYLQGFMYANGIGINKDEKQAVEFFNRAIKLGHPEAQNYLGFMYELGRGVPKDYQIAAEFYLAATKAELAVAHNNYAICCLCGVTGQQEKGNEIGNYKLAQKHFRCAEAHVDEAKVFLGFMYERGIIVIKNWFNTTTGKCDYQSAIKYYKRFADNPLALLLLGILKARGLGFSNPDSNETKILFRKAQLIKEDKNHSDYGMFIEWQQTCADNQNDVNAQILLATIYEYGLLGYSKENEKAFKYYQNAAKNDDNYAKQKVEEMKTQAYGRFPSLVNFIKNTVTNWIFFRPDDAGTQSLPVFCKESKEESSDDDNVENHGFS